MLLVLIRMLIGTAVLVGCDLFIMGWQVENLQLVLIYVVSKLRRRSRTLNISGARRSLIGLRYGSGYMIWMICSKR